MCINIASSFWVENVGQRLAEMGVFVSRLKHATAKHEEFNLMRLHFTRRHGGEWDWYPQYGFVTVEREISLAAFANDVTDDTVASDDDPNIAAYKAAMREDTPVGRGYWRQQEMKHLVFRPGWMHDAYDRGTWPQFIDERELKPSEEEKTLIWKSITKGRDWALTDNSIRPTFSLAKEGDPVVLGGWHRDANGCYLGYSIPVGFPIKVVGEGFYEDHGYQFGELGVEIPWGTRYALRIRCSDTGIHNGFQIIKLLWYQYNDGTQKVIAAPILASTFAAPHVFVGGNKEPMFSWVSYPSNPEIQLPEVGNDVAGAMELAKAIGGLV